jgi:hypothetical protein
MDSLTFALSSPSGGDGNGAEEKPNTALIVGGVGLALALTGVALAASKSKSKSKMGSR